MHSVRARFWIQFASHVAVPWLVLAFVGNPAYASPGSGPDNPSLAILAHALLLAGAVVAFLGLNPIALPPLSPAQFQNRSLIALALVEAGAFVGIFVVAGVGHADVARPFVILATAVNLLIVLPCALMRLKDL